MSLEWEIKGDVMFPSPESPLGILIRRGRSNTHVGLDLVSKDYCIDGEYDNEEIRAPFLGGVSMNYSELHFSVVSNVNPEIVQLLGMNPYIYIGGGGRYRECYLCEPHNFVNTRENKNTGIFKWMPYGPDVAIAFDGVPVVVFDGTNIVPNIGVTVNGGASTFV